MISVYKQKIKTKTAEWNWLDYWLDKKYRTTKTIERTRIVVCLFFVPIFWYTKDY